MYNGEFVFKIPSEAPVFEPTVEEFLDPLAYINKIRPVAEKTGICKVKPPPEWHPPFAVDVDHFKFTPRIQKLNELDANTRVKLYFLDRLATYWNYNGVQIRIPAIDDKTVDMYSLYKIVELEGGFEIVNVEKKWTKVASRMGYINEKLVSPQLRQHYKRLLLPYAKFEKMKNVQENGIKNKHFKKETNIEENSIGNSTSERLKIKVMQETTPDLFRNQPDLLHQLVTILNPNILMDRGVPVYHIDQAAVPENLNSKLASATHQDMLKMLDIENKQRKALLEWGVVNAEREAFELLADDERKCAECNTTCFLSAVTCICSPKKVTCLRHFKEHCSCPPIEHTLRYRYTLDELPVMLEKLKEKADSVASWAAKVHDALDVNTPRTITLSGLKELLSEAHEKHFPDDLSLNLLSKAIKSVQDALAVDFKNILSHKQTLSKKVTLVEIRSYYEELQRIPCVLPQENTVKHFLKFLDEFQENADRLLKNEQATVHDVETILKQGHFPNVEIPYIETLKNYKKVLHLIEEYEEKCKNPSIFLTLEVVEQLLICSKNINNPNSRVTAINKHLTLLREKILSWEMKVKYYVNSEYEIIDSESGAGSNENINTKCSLNKLENFLENANSIEAFLPSKEKLHSLIQKSLTWKNKATNILIQKKSPPVLFELLERLIDDGESIPVDFEEMPKLKIIANKVSQWKNEVQQLFMGDCKIFSLLDVLMPRKNLQRICRYKNVNCNTSEDEEKEKKFEINVMKEEVDLEKIISSFKVAEKREFELMRALRVKNTYKKKQGDGSFCICKNSSSTSMKECTLCKDLFHEVCLKQLVNYWEDKRYTSRIFLCPFCQRSKRPSSKSVMNALIKLQKLQIRTLEGIAMQCLIEREKKWKEAVNELLKTPELSTLSRITAELKSKTSKCNMPIKLSNENRNSLESLLFRGFLLELDLPENEIIYKILHKLDSNSDMFYQNVHYGIPKCQSQLSNFDQTKVDMELSNETCSLKNELATSFVLHPVKEKKRKYSVFTAENNDYDEGETVQRANIDKIVSIAVRDKSKNFTIHANAAAIMRKKNKKNHAVTFRMRQSFKLGRIGSNSNINNEVLDKREIILEKSLLYKKNSVSSSTSSSPAGFLQNDVNSDSQFKELEESYVDDDEAIGGGEEEETECDAKQCVKPSGEHVDWVQCDYCKNWLHMICIGVTKREVDNQTEFMCSLCRNVDSSKNKEDNVDDDDDDVVFIEYTSNNAALCSS
ncbi:hypothetical protein PGB90_003962 [Kerria lacca]